MKFLPREEENNDIVPLNIYYYRSDNFKDPDILTIIYKDLNTGEKRVHQIENPVIEAYIVKPEYRDYTHMRDWVEKDICYTKLVKYKSRWYELSKELGLNNSDEAKKSPYIFNVDIEIEDYYLMQFLIEYKTNKTPELSKGYLDIENDIIMFPDGVIPPYGESPINLVTYIDGSDKEVYTFILLKDALPEDKYCTDEERRLREMFIEQSTDFVNNIDKFTIELHEAFDESYPGMNFNLFTFNNESSLLIALWNLIHTKNNDYINIWNAPYDMGNLINRPYKLGLDPNDIIPDDRIEIKLPIEFREDTNPVAHKRKHTIKIYALPSILDQMVIYGGIRSGREKFSLKLNSVAFNELADTKLDYSEAADIKHLYYYSFKTAVMYNIKDVLLQYGIESKVKDIDTIYSRMRRMVVLPNQAFITTKYVLYYLAYFGFERNAVIGSNRNKYNSNGDADLYLDDEGNIIKDFSDDNDDLEESDMDDYLNVILSSLNSSNSEDQKDPKKRKKYQGAFVMNPLYQHPTGVKIMGKDAKYVHDHVGDEDIKSEYPSNICINNISNETLVGKIYLNHPEDFEIPIYDSFKFYGDEAVKYKLDVSNFMLECYSERDSYDFGELFLSLPNISEVLDIIDDNIDNLIE
jgi:hypothetical protein